MRSRPAWNLSSHRSILPGWLGHSCPPKSCPLCARSQRRPSCKILSSRERFHPQADSPRLTRLSLAAAPHGCLAPRSAPSASTAASSKKTPPGPKNSISEFPGSKGHNPDCRRVQMPRPQVSAGPYVSMRPHGGVLPPPPLDHPCRKAWLILTFFDWLSNNEEEESCSTVDS